MKTKMNLLNSRKIKVAKYLGYGYFVAGDKKAYTFEYERDRDEGLGVLVPQCSLSPNLKGYTVLDVKYDKKGDPKEVIVRVYEKIKEVA